ncbi:hypothetical protein GKZ89_16025 [Bacillus mangrovi]|uniref:PilZ domain-containing protein n=1 Tax=Metabacillus mangrovi TaxID=1491830 RepID=A0A7X2S822_9BACI|nr:PilZ domain-containing protein [Metabacillus mangrovi]MTH54911.1 hypothetical protein [Metabacillus mangrovi]
MEYMTIINKDHQSFSAALHYIEGELMNIVVKNLDGIELGGRLICKFENRTFSAYVLKIENYNLYLYVPIQEEKAPNDRRRFFRHSCQLTGKLADRGKELVEITIIDISLNGFGFITDRPLDQEAAYTLTVTLEGGETLQTNVSIQNQTSLPASLRRYGSQIQAITEDGLLALRKYLLHQQLTTVE